MKICIVSRHDFRTHAKASIHFHAEALARMGHEVKFLSICFSPLSRAATDGRVELRLTENKWELSSGVNCFLWKTPLHPLSVLGWRGHLFGWMFHLYPAFPSTEVDTALAQADILIFQSGPSPILIRRARKLNPRAKIIYLASDLLSTAKVHPSVQKVLDGEANSIDKVVVVARAMLSNFASVFGEKTRFIPHGIEKNRFTGDYPSPFSARPCVVAIGSMLFDHAAVFEAARLLPSIQFHLIGTGSPRSELANVRVYGRMPFSETVAYLKHADVGLAPYCPQDDGAYLVDSSLKLIQFGYLGVPAVCPTYAVGDKKARIGYIAGDGESMAQAILHAIKTGRCESDHDVLSWTEAAMKLIE